MPSELEIEHILNDLSWLDRCHCSQVSLDEFFVPAGRVISERALTVARTCPARREEIIFAYARGIAPGYSGGLSPAQRSHMTLQDALDLVEREAAELAVTHAAEAPAAA